MKFISHLLPVLLSVFLLGGCAGLTTRFEPRFLTPEARQAVAALEAGQTLPTAFKGLGKLKLRTDGRQRVVRLAWLVELPEKMRFEVLAPSGQSLYTISADENYIYLRPPPSAGEIKKIRAGNMNLERFTGVPARKTDLLRLLSGRLPVRVYDTAELVKDGTGGYILNLRRRWHGVVERVYFDRNLKRPYKVELLGGWKDRPEYSTAIRSWQQVDTLEVPREILLEGPEGGLATLTIRRYWPETDIAEEKFVLADPVAE